MSLPASPLRLLPTAATFVGWDFHPLKFRAFSRRTMDAQDEQESGHWGSYVGRWGGHSNWSIECRHVGSHYQSLTQARRNYILPLTVQDKLEKTNLDAQVHGFS